MGKEFPEVRVSKLRAHVDPQSLSFESTAFDVCQRKGLNGRQGVVIPAKNVKNLMLKRELVDSVKEGQFHIWPISNVEEGVEILTGIEAGVLQPNGTYPEGTLFHKADERLLELAEIARKFVREEEGAKPSEEE